MRYSYVLVASMILLSWGTCYGQSAENDSLFKTWNTSAQHDTIRLQALYELAWNFKDSNPDSFLTLAEKAYDYAVKVNAKKYEGKALLEMGIAQFHLGNFTKAEAHLNQSIPILKSFNDLISICIAYTALGNAANFKGDILKSLELQQQALMFAQEARDSSWIAMILNNTGNIYTSKADSIKARNYYTRSYAIAEMRHDTLLMGMTLTNIGMTYPYSSQTALQYFLKGLTNFKNIASPNLANSYSNIGLHYLHVYLNDSAIFYLNKSLDLSISLNDEFMQAESYANLGSAYRASKLYTQAIDNAERGLTMGKQVESLQLCILALESLYLSYKATNNPSKALAYHEEYKMYSDSLYNDNRKAMITQKEYEFEYQQKENQLKATQQQKNTLAKTRQYVLASGLFLMLFLAGVLFLGYRNKQKANLILHTQKAEIQSTLNQLKSTQTQLIQSEKMVSLGQLTAGIAHEIQNPLNFVNNFSEVNTELIDEMNHEIDKGNMPEVKSIAKDIKDNQLKINEHGKRADAIVKGMLQHSRSSSGVKEPTDINALADEYLRLAYHGLRAKDKSFNATMKTDFDENIGLINVVPQDIGRVILNLITNAFYAVSTFAPKSPEGDLPYAPTVTVRTKLLKSPSGDLGAKRDTGDLGAKRVEISVSDNGPGIPQHILDKIFQPFFTTKPTGQGTGLGLSLSYDIVKAHGGELKVATEEGVGSTFVINLPII